MRSINCMNSLRCVVDGNVLEDSANFIDRIHEWAVAVNQKQQKHLSEICRCGKVKLEAVGRQILPAPYYGASCQEAGSRFEHLASAPPVLNPDGGTDYVLYRKDRVQCVTGQEDLEEHRLKPDF